VAAEVARAARGVLCSKLETKMGASLAIAERVSLVTRFRVSVKLVRLYHVMIV